MNRRSFIVFSGSLWFVIGLALMYRGLHYISEAQMDPNALSKGSSSAGNWIIFFALVVGFIKGRFIFAKTVERVVSRIRALSAPIRFWHVYSLSYWILIASMMGISLLFKYLPIPVDIRGFINLAVGSALVNGSMLYFRAARTVAS